jgi:hypothetical protein
MAEHKKRRKFEHAKSHRTRTQKLKLRETPDDEKTVEWQCGRYRRPSYRGTRHLQRLQMPATLEKEPSPEIKNHTARH